MNIAFIAEDLKSYDKLGLVDKEAKTQTLSFQCGVLTYALQIRLYCITSDNVTKVGLFTRILGAGNEKMKRSKAAEIRKSFKIVIRLEPVQTGSKLVFNSTRIDGKHCFCCPSLAITAWVQSTLSSLCQLSSNQGRRQISATPKEILGDAKNLTWGHWGRNKEHWFRLGLPQERT